MGVSGQRHAPAALTPRKIVVTHCTGGWVGLRAGLECAENLANTGIRFLDRPERVESRYTDYTIAAHKISAIEERCGFGRKVQFLFNFVIAYGRLWRNVTKFRIYRSSVKAFLL